MGTRHLTVFNDNNGKEIVVMYGQFDGYLSGYGQDLKNFLDGFYIVNGYCTEDYQDGVQAANGMGCLAAQLIASFKENIRSDFHLYAAGSRDMGEEYIYTIYTKDFDQCVRQGEENWSERRKASIYIRAARSGRSCSPSILYDGPVSEFNPSEIKY